MGRPYDWHGRILPAGMDPDSVIGTLSTGFLDNAKLDFMGACPAGMVLASHPSIDGDRPRMRAVSTVVPPTVPAGSSTYIQFNNAGAFGGSADLTWNSGSFLLSVGASSGGSIDLWGGRLSLRQAGDIKLYNGAETFSGVLSLDAIDADRAWQLPNVDGVLAVVTQIKTSSGSAGVLQLADGSGGFQDGTAATHAEDMTITDSSKGLVLTSPDATQWRITVDNAGALSVTAI